AVAVTARGRERWKSDGSAAGTLLAKDINAGSGSSGPDLPTNKSAPFFSPADRTNGPELWKSDGTAAGTVLVRDINRGTAYPYALRGTNVNGTLLFAAFDPETGGER